jgi:hypothetical protein
MGSLRSFAANHRSLKALVYLIEYVDKTPNMSEQPMSAPLPRQNRGQLVKDRPFRRVAGPGMNWCVSAKAKPQTARSEEVHGSQDEFPWLIHRVGHAVQERLAR